MNEPQASLESQPHRKNPKKIALIIIISLVTLAVGFVLALQQLTIMKLSADVAKLEKTQLPTKQFDSYQDCIDNGGRDLFAGDFSACVGGEVNEGFGNQLYLQYSAQNLPRLTEHKVSENENRVDGADKASEALVAFLKEDYSGCEIGSADGEGQGYYNVVKELPNRFALLNYGCVTSDTPEQDNSTTFMIAIKLGEEWSLISPTNHFNENGVPSCLMVDMFRISKEISPQCFQNTGHNNGSLRNVSYN